MTFIQTEEDVEFYYTTDVFTEIDFGAIKENNKLSENVVFKLYLIISHFPSDV